ncbi:MAG: hypothetical protein QOE14_206 [Humisphaera sp.]|nr:hypothetical protein [Humisphaera sp.]
MAIGRSSSFLGVAVSDRSVTCAEVSISGDRRTVSRTATFAFPDAVTFDSPDALGQALAAFLRQRRFTASRVVVGVPARWLIAIEKEVPPADDQQARATLRLQAERLAVAESGDVVFDFAGRTSSSTMSKVLLVGMVREKLQRVEQMMDAAGMTVVAVTSTGLTLAACATRGKGIDSGNGGGGVLMLGRNGGEVIWRHDGAPRMLRHVAYLMNGHGLPPIAPLGAELHRAVSFAAANGDVGRELLVLDGVGLPAEQVKQLSDRLGVPVRADDGVRVLKVDVDPAAAAAATDNAADEPSTIGRFAPAMSLALAAAKPELLPLDFKHSRLTPAPPQRVSRAQKWGIAIGATVIIALLALYFGVRSKEKTLAELESQLAARKSDIAAASENVERVKYGRGYFEARPPILDCLRELSLTFGETERIWVTNVTYRERNRFTITGKSADPKTPLAVADRMRANPRFSDVRMPGGIVEADARTREVTFSVSFQFNPAE